MGFETIGWGFSKRMGFHWGWLKVNRVALKSMGSTFDGDVTGGRITLLK